MKKLLRFVNMRQTVFFLSLFSSANHTNHEKWKVFSRKWLRAAAHVRHPGTRSLRSTKVTVRQGVDHMEFQSCTLCHSQQIALLIPSFSNMAFHLVGSRSREWVIGQPPQNTSYSLQQNIVPHRRKRVYLVVLLPDRDDRPPQPSSPRHAAFSSCCHYLHAGVCAMHIETSGIQWVQVTFADASF